MEIYLVVFILALTVWSSGVYLLGKWTVHVKDKNPPYIPAALLGASSLLLMVSLYKILGGI